MDKKHPHKFRSLSSKFSIFTGLLLLWVIATILWWDIQQHSFDWAKGVILCGVVVMVAAAISRFTGRLLARPLALLEAGITSVRQGRLQQIQVSRTGDEIEYLGESFNRMIETLAASQAEIRQQQNCSKSASGSGLKNWRRRCMRRLPPARQKVNFWPTCRTNFARP